MSLQPRSLSCLAFLAPKDPKMWTKFLGGKTEAVYLTQHGIAYCSQNFSCCKKNCISANEKMNPTVPILHSSVFLHRRCPSCLVQIPCCFHSALCLLSLLLSLSVIHPRKFGKLQDPGLQKERQKLTSAPEQHLQRPHCVPLYISAYVTKGGSVLPCYSMTLRLWDCILLLLDGVSAQVPPGSAPSRSRRNHCQVKSALCVIGDPY